MSLNNHIDENISGRKSVQSGKIFTV